MITKKMKKNKIKIDAVDSQMIVLLQNDGRISNTAIAKKLGIAESTVRTRLKRLIDNKIVQIVAVSSPFDLGFQVAGNFKISIDLKKKDSIMQELVAIKELWYVVLTTGGTDVDADFIAPSFEDLQTLIFEKINKIDGINKIETSLIMQYGKHKFDWGTAIP
ncbi:MAG: Lrp/AsnC family transcriptional regulator [Proteobacteria bacterium]|nr:Lrp/AsnC family transcriptional regulator [Pseudomonadota bacterium]MBU1582261.1 Lrp/AsnC family transcriptional regulator [Pseudomonadota bacterium]MBU2632033.1 Lrp/AsnC family transcriptional regulator [Pseudomonadota bacterium]